MLSMRSTCQANVTDFCLLTLIIFIDEHKSLNSPLISFHQLSFTPPHNSPNLLHHYALSFRDPKHAAILYSEDDDFCDT